MALTLILVSTLVIESLDNYFFNQEQVDLDVRATTVRDFVVALADTASGDRPVVGPDNILDPVVRLQLQVPTNIRFLADRVAQANLQIRIGSQTTLPNGSISIVPSQDAQFSATLNANPQPGQSREPISYRKVYPVQEDALFTYAVEVTLSSPYTFRASTLRDVAALLLVIAIVTLGLAIVLASFLARRFTTPLRRIKDASRRIADGDLSSRVPVQRSLAVGVELAELSAQFNAMAARLQDSVETIRHDRDRSRDFLADVSHELRTPLAALRTFNELLKEQAADDPDARAEFLDSSGQQIERLDWLAQNLLELSKLDSGLVLLDLRPEDLRAAVESAVEQAEAAAQRRGVALTLHLPAQPVRIRHDPQRVGQVVSNLVGNALKFTPRGGRVDVECGRMSRAPRSRSGTRASASTRPSCRTSSNASTAARRRTRRGAAAAALASRSSSRSSTCTAVESASRAASVPGRRSSSACPWIRGCRKRRRQRPHPPTWRRRAGAGSSGARARFPRTRLGARVRRRPHRDRRVTRAEAPAHRSRAELRRER